MKQKRRIITRMGLCSVGVLCLVMFSGCLGLATKNDAVNIRIELRELRKEVTELKKVNADLRIDIDAQNAYIEQLGGKVDATTQRTADNTIRKASFDEIAKRLYAIEDKLLRLWTSTAPIASALPEDMYAMAKTDYQRGDFELAILGFSRLIAMYPDSPLVPHTYYELANAYYSTDDWKHALQQLEIFTSLYPSDEWMPRVLLLKARVLGKQGEHMQEKKALESIMQQYPLTEESKLAKDMIEKMLLVK